MIIVGAKGFAKEVIECLNDKQKNDLVFYDDVNENIANCLFDIYPILTSEEQAKTYFREINSHFSIGVGGPENRYFLTQKFVKLGGVLKTIKHKDTTIGVYDNEIKDGCIICPGVRITNSVRIGIGVLLNLNVTVGHDTIIGNYTEICPNVNISGNCEIGDKVFLGTGAVILPKIKIGNGAIVGAGAIVTKNVEPNTIVVGNPAKRINR